MMGGDMGFGAIVRIAKALAVLCVVLAPLALWKLGEIVWWLVTHVRVTW